MKIYEKILIFLFLLFIFASGDATADYYSIEEELIYSYTDPESDEIRETHVEVSENGKTAVVTSKVICNSCDDLIKKIYVFDMEQKILLWRGDFGHNGHHVNIVGIGKNGDHFATVVDEKEIIYYGKESSEKIWSKNITTRCGEDVQYHDGNSCQLYFIDNKNGVFIYPEINPNNSNDIFSMRVLFFDETGPQNELVFNETYDSYYYKQGNWKYRNIFLLEEGFAIVEYPRNCSEGGPAQEDVCSEYADIINITFVTNDAQKAEVIEFQNMSTEEEMIVDGILGISYDGHYIITMKEEKQMIIMHDILTYGDSDFRSNDRIYYFQHELSLSKRTLVSGNSNLMIIENGCSDCYSIEPFLTILDYNHFDTQLISQEEGEVDVLVANTVGGGYKFDCNAAYAYIDNSTFYYYSYKYGECADRSSLGEKLIISFVNTDWNISWHPEAACAAGTWNGCDVAIIKNNNNYTVFTINNNGFEVYDMAIVYHPDPDFVIDEMTFTPDSPSNGTEIIITTTVVDLAVNSGAHKVPISFFVDGVNINETYAVFNGENTEFIINTTWIYTTENQGLKVVIDSENTIDEADKENNQFTISLTNDNADETKDSPVAEVLAEAKNSMNSQVMVAIGIAIVAIAGVVFYMRRESNDYSVDNINSNSNKTSLQHISKEKKPIFTPKAEMIAIECPGCSAQMKAPQLNKLQEVTCKECGLSGEIEI